MEKFKEKFVELKALQVIKSLEENNMNGFFVKTKEDAKKLVEELINKGDVVSHGGSVTLDECGIKDLLSNGNYEYLDRSAPNLTSDEIMDIYRKTFFADVYLTSTNAITTNGELYNVDGNSNRISAMLFGPKKVIVIAGYNKIVNSIEEAANRVKSIAAPANCMRLDKKTYCSEKGECVALSQGDSSICSGCSSSDRICRNFTIMSKQGNKGRVNVIIVGEELGY